MKTKTPGAKRIRRHLRVRKRLSGTPERPRLCVFRSSSHIYAQVVDDSQGNTLVAASDIDPTLRGQRSGLKKTDVAKVVGKTIGERAKAAGISKVVFDRGGFQYHGRVKALADSAREAGLEF
jgi:large subunit ribosomal protein L18